MFVFIWIVKLSLTIQYFTIQYFIPSRPDFSSHNAGDDREVCSDDSIRHRVRLHSRTLPDGAEEYSYWYLLHGLQDRQHHCPILHLLK